MKMNTEKKLIAGLLAALLILTVSGCGGAPEDETAAETVAPLTEAPTEAPTQAPTEAPTQAPTEAPATVPPVTEKEYPAMKKVPVLIEGEPAAFQLDLFDGGNYVVYLTHDEWALETSLVDGYLVDRWVCTFNDMMDFQVISFGNKTVEEAGACIRQMRPQYSYDESAPEYTGGMDMDTRYFMDVDIRTDGVNTFAMVAEFPMEAGDGMAPRYREMMKSFEIK